MKYIDTCEQGLRDISWSPDGRWLTYVKNKNDIYKVGLASPDEVHHVTTGAFPVFNADNDILFERDAEIYVHRSGTDSKLIGQKDVIANTPKLRPRTSPDGKTLVFVMDNVFHKESQSQNAYPYRSFFGVAQATESPRPRQLGHQQWYGGDLTWTPNSDYIAHFEYDSTGGARIHIADLDGNETGRLFGLHPAFSPDGKHLACKPKSGQNLVIYTTKSANDWSDDNVNTVVCKLPAGGRLSGSPPMWLDNRNAIVDEGGNVYRVDTRKQEASIYKQIPVPSLRGTRTISLSPDRSRVAVEIPTENGFTLGLVDNL